MERFDVCLLKNKVYLNLEVITYGSICMKAADKIKGAMVKTKLHQFVVLYE